MMNRDDGYTLEGERGEENRVKKKGGEDVKRVHSRIMVAHL
jgi:hypothetical protein